jgi:hypothetical protein
VILAAVAYEALRRIGPGTQKHRHRWHADYESLLGLVDDPEDE